MPNTKFDRDSQRFESGGLDLNHPVDALLGGKYPILVNMRNFQEGRLDTRDGLTVINTGVTAQPLLHSARRLNDPSTADFTRIIGAGTHVAWGKTVFTDLDSGYSGEPLALVPWRPEASPTPFMYVADSSRMRKVGVAGALHTIGLAAPTAPPSVGLTTVPSYKVVDDFFATAGWAQGGTAGAPALLTWRVDTTIDKIVFDTGSTGWATCVPASIGFMGPGTRLNINPGGGAAETVVVQAMTPGFASTTIARSIYDDASTGFCSIVLTTPVNSAAVDAFIYDSTAGVVNGLGRIIAVTTGPDGTVSLRVQTPANLAFFTGDTIQILPSFRAYFVNTHSSGQVIRSDGVRSTVTVGTGTLTKAAATLDLSMLLSGVAANPEDYMHISVRVSDPTMISEIKVLLDCDSATNDFTRNYYWRSFRPSDLTSAAANLQTLLQANQTSAQRVVVRTILVSNLTQEQANELAFQGIIPTSIDATAPDSWSQELQALYATAIPVYANEAMQMFPGSAQWAEMRFRLSDLIRVGTDTSRTLRDVASLRITVIALGTVNIDVSSWWIGGGYGPDTGDPTATSYYYRYRARNIATNVPSNCSPATRYQANPLRQKVTISPTQFAAPSGTSLSTSDFVLDIERFGGLVAAWHYIGTASNGATPSFVDTLNDDVIAGNPGLGNENYQPWPIIGLVVSGTTGSVAGTTVNDSSTTFSLSWAPGTRILIANTPYTIYRVISTSRLEIVENAGSQTGVVWRIDAPTILAQPLACLWEHADTFFGCGDPVNPGRLYYSNANSETTTPSNYLDLSSPSEPLMNGLSYNIRPYVFSSENLFQGLPTGDPSDPWRYERIPNGKGLFSRWALTREPSPIIAFLGKDGIYATTGGAAVSLTDKDLYPFFPREGNLGNTYNTLVPPNIISTKAASLRITQYDGFIYFDFIDTANQRATLLCDLNEDNSSGSWYYDSYTPGILFHYGEEGAGVHALLCGSTGGATAGSLYQYTGNSDDGSSINCHFRTPSRDQGDARLNKLYGDIMLDCDAAGVSLTCTPGTNNHTTTYTPVTVNNSGRAQTAIALGSSWPTAKNISLDVTYSASTSARPMFFIWEPRWTFESAPISALSWEISPTTFGMENFKSLGICKITHVSTVDLSFIVIVDGSSQTTITIPHSSGLYAQTIFRTPVYKGKLIKIRLLSTTEWRLDPRDSFIEVKDWASDGAYQRLRVFGDYSLVEG